MDTNSVRRMLFWCGVINYGILLVWFLLFIFAHDWIYSLHSRWFHLSVAQFDMLHYAGMAVYKLGILLFNVAPYLAFHIVRRV